MTVLDWLRRDPREAPTLEAGGRTLPITVRRNPQAKRMTLRLAPDGAEVRVTIPRWTPTAEALAFARGRADWLADQLSHVAAPVALTDGAEILFRGACHVVRHVPESSRRVRLTAGEISLGGPPESLASRLERWLRTQAHGLLEADLAEYCLRAGVAAPRLSLGGAQRRWGSCSARGSIRINWRLVMAPDEVRRSVVAHEVAHLAHFDHSPAFKAHLRALFEGDLPAADAWLKRHGRSLYAPFG